MTANEPGKPVDLQGCYITFTTICKALLKLGLLKIVAYGLYCRLENIMRAWPLTENRVVFFFFLMYLRCDCICLLFGPRIGIFIFFVCPNPFGGMMKTCEVSFGNNVFICKNKIHRIIKEANYTEIQLSKCFAWYSTKCAYSHSKQCLMSVSRFYN